MPAKTKSEQVSTFFFFSNGEWYSLRLSITAALAPHVKACTSQKHETGIISDSFFDWNTPETSLVIFKTRVLQHLDQHKQMWTPDREHFKSLHRKGGQSVQDQDKHLWQYGPNLLKWILTRSNLDLWSQRILSKRNYQLRCAIMFSKLKRDNISLRV